MAEETRIRLKSYFETGDKPKAQEFIHLIDSMVHKNDGKIIDSVTTDNEGNITFLFVGGQSIIIPKYQLPAEMSVSFITDLQAILDNKTETGGYAGTSQDLYSLIQAIKTIYSSDGTLKGKRTIDGASKTGSLVFDNLKTFEVTNNDNFTVKNSISTFTSDLFKADARKTIDLSVPTAKARIILEDGLALQNGTQAAGRYLQSVDINGKTIWKNLEISDLSGIAEMVQDMIINSGATDKIASVKAIEDFVAAKILELINSSPTALDTLKELAEALGNDPNFATTITTQIATKLATGGYIGTAQDLFNEILVSQTNITALQNDKLDKGGYVGNAQDLNNAKRDKTAQVKSITDTAGNLELVGDVDTPSSDSFYGTDATGSKTFVKTLDVLNFLTFKREEYSTSDFDFNGLVSIPTNYLDQDLTFERGGQYAFMCTISASSDSTFSNFVAKIFLDDLLELDVINEEFVDDKLEQRHKRTLFGITNVTPGAHNFKLIFNDSLFRTAELHKAEVLIFKIADNI